MFRFIISFLICVYSCKTVSVIKRIHSERPEIITFSNKKKLVKYIPMHHVGKQNFYLSVKKLVDSFKKDGYVVFYGAEHVKGTLLYLKKFDNGWTKE